MKGKDTLSAYLLNIKNASPEEKEIVDLILASVDNGIISKNIVKSKDDGYFTFTFEAQGSELRKSYEICFGKNPEKNHPNAERALRASDFVTRLLNVINTRYNCYIAPCEIEGPDPEDIRVHVFNPEFPVSVFKKNEQRGRKVLAPNTSVFEIEVAIIVTFNQTCVRIHDTVVATTQKNNGVITNVKYEYKKIVHQGATNGDDQEMTEENKSKAQTATEEILNRIYGCQGGKGKNNDKKQILDALAEAPDSQFRKYLDSLKGKGVGQIRVQPTSIYVEAQTQKTFPYSVKVKKDNEIAQLDVVWDKKDKTFNADTPLYVEIDCGGRVKGLTSIKSDSSVKFEKHSLVPYFTISNNKSKLKGFTLWSREWISEAEARMHLNPSVAYVGKASAPYLSEVCYESKDVVHIDGSNILNCDTMFCEYTQATHWIGDMSPDPLLFVDNDGKRLMKGKVYKYASTKMGSCRFCGTRYIADSRRLELYQNRHRLLNGEIYCDNCKIGENLTTNGKHYRLIENVKKIEDNNRCLEGMIYAELSEPGGAYLKPEQGGNVFVCSECKKIICYTKGQDYFCDFCNARICKECKTIAIPQNNRLVKNRVSHLCSSCPTIQNTSDKGIRLSNKGKDALYRVWNVSETEEFLIVDDENDPKFIFYCTDCGKMIYSPEEENSNQENPYKTCDCCGRRIGAKCFEEISLDEVLEMKLCHFCKKQMDTDEYKEQAKKVLAATANAQQQKVEKEKRNQEFKCGWADKVCQKEELEKYIPFLLFPDRYGVKRALTRLTPIKKLISVEFLDGGADSEDSFMVRFSLKIKNRTYYFINCSNSITLEEWDE